ncbi:MAG TPA: CPBP family intramembrane glutamic endopeptidase [Bryobacteraceae bacterium]
MLALPLIWLACAIAGALYAAQQNIPFHLAFLALPAFLLEATFYAVLGIERWRARLEKLPPAAVAGLLVVAAAAPYCAASLAFGFFHWQALAWIAGLAAVASFWYVALPDKAPVDIGFLLLLAIVVMTNILRRQYVNPVPKLRLDELGALMWIRTGAFAMLSVRRMKGVGFGFWPEGPEWLVGVGYFAGLVPFAGVAAWLVGFAAPHLPPPGWDRVTVLAIGTFFGVLWVLALGEEFFFRGLLQQWLGEWLGNQWLGLGVASVVFGLVHLWYRTFPNWRFALLATIAGIFYGLAFRQSHSIRASMVTHALTVTTWRLFFS